MLTNYTDKQHHYFLIETTEVALIGFSSLICLCLYSILLWSLATSSRPDEEDRWSFRRSIKVFAVSAIVDNVYQIIFLICKTTNTFNLLEDVEDTATDVFEAVDQYFYCTFVYCLTLCLVKPIAWPSLRFDFYLYLLTLLPPCLNLIIRITLIASKIKDHQTQSAVNTVTSVLSSFILYLVPLTITIISAVLNSRRQPEHFMKVSCQRMGIIFGVHLALGSLYFSLYSFAACHKYEWSLSDNEYICEDHLRATNSGKEHEDQIDAIFTTSIPPNPSTIATPINVIVIVLNVLSNILLPFIPGSFMYTVQTLLVE